MDLNPSRTSPSGHVLGNAASSWLRDLVEGALFFVLTPLILRELGTEQYGLWSLLWAIVQVLILFDMGFGTSVVKLVADARGRNDAGSHRTAVATFFWTYVAQATFLLLVVVAIATWVDPLFGLPPALGDVARQALWILGGVTAIGLPLGMFRGILLGHQKQRVANFYKLGGSILYFGVAVAVLAWIPDVRALAAANAVCALLPLLMIAAHASTKLPGVTVRPRHFAWSRLRSVWTFSFSYMSIHVAAIAGTRIDTFVVQWALDLRAVAIYAIAMRLAEKASQVCLQLARSLSPVVAELHGAGDEAQLRDVWLRGTKFSVAFAAPLVAGLAWLAEPLIVAWAGPDLAPSARVLQVLLVATMLFVIHANSHNLLSMGGEHRSLALIVVAGQVLNIGLSVALVRSLGLLGVASATAASTAVVNLVAVHRRVRRRWDVSLGQLYRRTVLPSLPPACAMIAAFFVWEQAYGVDGVPEVALLELLGIGLFWGLFWRIGCDETEREMVRVRMRRVRRRLAPKPADDPQEP